MHHTTPDYPSTEIKEDGSHKTGCVPRVPIAELWYLKKKKNPAH